MVSAIRTLLVRQVVASQHRRRCFSSLHANIGSQSIVHLQQRKDRQQIINSNSSQRLVNFRPTSTSVADETASPQEISLQLITADDPLWLASDVSKLPFPEPFWSFLWPGGYGATCWILDNQKQVANSTVLDIGSGCGSVAIAAVMAGAQCAVANDIDDWAGDALYINATATGLGSEEQQRIEFTKENLVCHQDQQKVVRCIVDDFDFIVAGDVLYDQTFGLVLLDFLQRIANERKTRVIIGDPSRHVLFELIQEEHDRVLQLETGAILHLLQSYEVPPDLTPDNSLPVASVWELMPEKH